MRKENKIIIIVLFLIAFFVVGLIGGGTYLSAKTTRFFLLTEYTCEQIDLGISGVGVPYYTDYFKTRYYQPDKLYVYYKLNCIE